MKRKRSWLELSAYRAAVFTGSSTAFFLALGIIVCWLISGFFFHYSDTWQLVINTGTTVITFLMVFLIQRTQNKDSRAIHLKLNELVGALQGPSNRLINVEHLSEAELATLSRFYARLAEMARKDLDLSQSHSVEEAEELHRQKYPKRKAGIRG